MLYEIKVYEIKGNKRNRLYSTEIQAPNGVIALERACVRFNPSRICEIREIGTATEIYPQVKKIQRDGVV